MYLKLILGITLSLVLVASSIPLSFGSFVGSPHFQLKSGVALENILCRENHVLVLRPNDNLACVKDSTAERFGWEKIEKSSQLIMDVELDPILYSGAPVSSKMFEVNAAAINPNSTTEPICFPSDSEIIISKFPRVGDIIDVTFITTYTPTYPYQGTLRVIYTMSDGMEFINIPADYELDYKEPYTHLGKYYPGKYTLTIPRHDFVSYVPQSFSVQVKALTEGYNGISAKVCGQGSGIGFVIGSQETLLSTDYYLKYPDERPEELTIDWPTTPQEQTEFEKKYGYSFGTTTVRTDITEEEYRAWLEENKYSQAEIEETIERSFPTITNSFAIPLDITVDVFGTLTMDNSDLSPDLSTAVHGAEACLLEFDNDLSIWNTLDCQNTSSTGGFAFTNIDKSRNDGSLDLVVGFYSDSRDSIVQQTDGSLYQVFSSNAYDTTADLLELSYYISADDDFITSPFRAFWIIDAISDAHEFKDDEFNQFTSKVTETWT